MKDVDVITNSQCSVDLSWSGSEFVLEIAIEADTVADIKELLLQALEREGLLP